MTKPVAFLADGSASPTTLKNVEEWAAANLSQGTIAARLGIPRRQFEQELAKGKGNNAMRLAWERGTAIVEQKLRDSMFGVALGEEKYEDVEEPVLDAEGKPTGELTKVRQKTIYVSKGATTTAIFVAKSQFGWKEGESEDKKASNVTLLLPRPRSREEFFAMMGIVDPRSIAGTAASDALKLVEPTEQKALAPPVSKGVTR